MWSAITRSDQANLSPDAIQLSNLSSALANVPPIRENRVTELTQALRSGNHVVSDHQIGPSHPVARCNPPFKSEQRVGERPADSRESCDRTHPGAPERESCGQRSPDRTKPPCRQMQSTFQI